MRNGCRWITTVAFALATAMLALGLSAPPAQAQQPKEVEVGLLVPLSGLYARFGTVMRMGAEMSVEHVNAEGGVKAPMRMTVPNRA